MAEGEAGSDKMVCLSDIEFRFDGSKDGFRLSIPTLELKAGERVALVGPSGSGKSTLLGLIAGVLQPQKGTVDVLDHRLSALSGGKRDRFRADNLGIIFQQFNLLPYLSPLDNVLMALEFSALRTLGSVEKRDRAMRLLSALGLDASKMALQKVSQLSVGQQQRVAAARAFVGDPKLIIADEPTSALDEGRQDEFLDLLFEQQAKTGATLLLVTHDTRVASRFDRVLEIESIILRETAGVAAR